MIRDSLSELQALCRELKTKSSLLDAAAASTAAAAANVGGLGRMTMFPRPRSDSEGRKCLVSYKGSGRVTAATSSVPAVTVKTDGPSSTSSSNGLFGMVVGDSTTRRVLPPTLPEAAAPAMPGENVSRGSATSAVAQACAPLFFFAESRVAFGCCASSVVGGKGEEQRVFLTPPQLPRFSSLTANDSALSAGRPVFSLGGSASIVADKVSHDGALPTSSAPAAIACQVASQAVAEEAAVVDQDAPTAEEREPPQSSAGKNTAVSAAAGGGVADYSKRPLSPPLSPSGQNRRATKTPGKERSRQQVAEAARYDFISPSDIKGSMSPSYTPFALED